MSNELLNYTDADLWQAFKAGNKEVLSFIYLQHHKHLVNYGIRLCARAEVVEDLIHDVFIECWQRRKTIATVNSIRFYLLKSLRNKIFTYLKKQKSAADIDLHTDNYHFHVEYSFEDTLIAETGDAELKNKLLHALNLLSARQKEAIYLRFYNSLDYPEIASIMAINYQSVRTHIYQAIKLLREKLAVELALLVFILHSFTSDTSATLVRSVMEQG
jgi:RNA polymerase sigma factor (sigma-70 family)